MYLFIADMVIWSILTGESTAGAEQFVVQEGKKSYNNVRHFSDFNMYVCNKQTCFVIKLILNSHLFYFICLLNLK